MSKRYETVFIMTPVLSDDQAKETVNKFRELLIGKGAEIVHEEDWGLRKMAYQIQKKSTGFYYLLEWNYTGNENMVAFIELMLKRDERIIRYLTVQLDKYGVEYNERKRKPKVEVKVETEESVNE